MSALHGNLPGGKDGAVLAKQRNHGIYPAAACSYAGLNGFRFLQFHITGQEQPTHLGDHNSLIGCHAQDLFFLFTAGRHGSNQSIKPAARQGYFQVLSCGKGSLGHHAFIGPENLVVHRQFQGDMVSGNRLKRRFQLAGGNNPGILGSRLSINGILHLALHKRHFSNKEMLVELLGFSGSIRHRNVGRIEIPFILGLEKEGEFAGGIQGLRVFQEKYVGTHLVDLNMNAGATQAVTGITLYGAAHGHFTAGSVQPVQLVKAQGKRGKYELIHAARLGSQALYLQREKAASEARRNHKLSGYGAPVVGGKTDTVEFLVLGVFQDYIHLLAFADSKGHAGIAFVHHGLEFDRITGTVGSAVQIDVAARTGIQSAHTIVPAQVERLRTAVSAHGLDAVIRFIVFRNLPGKGFRQQRKAVHPQRRCSHLLVSFLENQVHLGKRLSGLVIGHVDTSAPGILAGSQGEGISRVDALGGVLPAHRLNGVLPVGQLGQVHAHRILHIEAPVKIGHLPSLDGLLALT